MGTQECRICLAAGEESELCEPCACSGHLRYAHFTCAQQWINVCPRADRDTCEVCRTTWKLEFTLPSTPSQEQLNAETRDRLYRLVCSAYLRISCRIERPRDQLLLRRLGPMFEHVPGSLSGQCGSRMWLVWKRTHELTAWAQDRIAREGTVSTRFGKWCSKVKSQIKAKFSRSASSDDNPNGPRPVLPGPNSASTHF